LQEDQDVIEADLDLGDKLHASDKELNVITCSPIGTVHNNPSRFTRRTTTICSVHRRLTSRRRRPLILFFIGRQHPVNYGMPLWDTRLLRWPTAWS
jgi:hypothetical protein